MKKAALFIWFVLWACLIAGTAPSVYWRDSGEFILSGYFLDIAHPPGFPLYSQLANLSAQFPIGPIAFRVNALSTFAAAGACALAWLLASELLAEVSFLERRARALLALLPAAMLFGSRAFLTQALTTEVYGLNALCIEILLLLYLYYRRYGDGRLLITASFVGGLSLGNHVSIAFALAGFVAIALTEFSRLRPLIVPCLIAGIAGLSVYAYIPVRARTNPPLNTGGATTLNRFLAHVTDERDRTLRHESEVQGPPGVTLLSKIASDLRKIRREVPLVLLLIAVAGVVRVVRYPRLSAALAVAALSNWLFFLDWDPDPWLPLFLVIGVFLSLGAAWCLERLRFAPRAEIFSATFFLLLVLTPAVLQGRRAYAAFAHFDRVAASAAEFLADQPRSGVTIVEASWFPAAYLRTIELLREDLLLLYQPQILFPSLFAPVELASRSSPLYCSSEESDERSRLLALLHAVATKVPLSFEPVPEINRWLASAASLTATGTVVIGPSPGDPNSFTITQLARMRQLKEAHDQAAPDYADAHQYLETIANGTAGLLAEKQFFREAIELLRTVCMTGERMECSEVTYNNIAVYSMADGQYEAAAELLLRTLHDRPRRNSTVVENLRRAWAHLDAGGREGLRQRPGFDAILAETGMP